MTKKVLITGSEGMLAFDLKRVFLATGYQVIGLSHDDLDITQYTQVKLAINDIRPDLVINTPGIGVDVCEDDPEKGFNLHSWASGVLSIECQKIGARLVYISTCGLFGDEIKFNTEYDPVVLKTQYACSKYMGEQIALRNCTKTYIVRPGWLFGGQLTHARNFVYQRYQEALSKSVLFSASDKFGSPTYTYELAEKIVSLVDTGEYGLYHIANEGSASRFEYVKFIVECFGLDTKVESVDSSFYPRPAPVPDSELLSNLNIKFLGLAPMDSWQESIERYVFNIKNDLV